MRVMGRHRPWRPRRLRDRFSHLYHCLQLHLHHLLQVLAQTRALCPTLEAIKPLILQVEFRLVQVFGALDY